MTGQYGNFGSGGDKPMEVYDVTGDRCEDPVHLGTVVWPENIHNLTISGNGRYVFATQPTQVVDISPMFEGKPYGHLGNLDNVMDYPLVSPAPGADLDDAVPGARQRGLPTTYFGHEAAELRRHAGHPRVADARRSTCSRSPTSARGSSATPTARRRACR